MMHSSPARPRLVDVVGTSLVTEGALVTTEALASAVGRDPADVVRKTGIRTRYVTAPDVPVSALGARALLEACADAGIASTDIGRVVLAHSTGGLYKVPATVGDVLLRAGLSGRAHGFDLNDACMGFVKAFDAAASMVHADGIPTAVVAVETLFRHTRPDVPRPHLVFGDAAAAAILVPGAGRIHRAWMRNDMAIDGGARLDHGDADDPHPPFTFHLPSQDMAELAVGWVVTAAREAVAVAGVGLDDVPWVLPHQPNGPMRDRILAALGKVPEDSVDVVGDLGSIGAASIAAGLHRLRRSGRLRPGDLVLLTGVGGGGTYGALVVELAA